MSHSQWVDIEESEYFRRVVEFEGWDVAFSSTLAIGHVATAVAADL